MKRNGFADYELLPKIAIIALVAACALPILSRTRHYVLYNKAETLAIEKFGDKKVPLTEAEREEWYKKMGVTGTAKFGYNPSRTQLENFINDYK